MIFYPFNILEIIKAEGLQQFLTAIFYHDIGNQSSAHVSGRSNIVHTQSDRSWTILELPGARKKYSSGITFIPN